MVTRIDCLDSNRNFLLVIIFACALNAAMGQTPTDSLLQMNQKLDLINQLQEGSNYKASLNYCLELIAQADRIGGSQAEEIKDQAKMYLLEAYRELQMFSSFESAVNEFETSLEQSKKNNGNSTIEIVNGFGRILLYADFFVIKKNYKKANHLLQKAIQHILDHPQFYLMEFTDGKDCKPHRLWLCYHRLGQIAFEEQNFAQAKVYWIEALKHARLADIAIRKKGIAEQGCEENGLINLIKLAIKSRDNQLLDYYLNAYHGVKKSAAYGNNRNRDLLLGLLQKEDLIQEQGLILIHSINANPLAAADLETQFNIIDFYLKYQAIGPCRELIKKLEPLIHHSNQKADWYLAKAGLSTLLSEYGPMSQYIDSSLYYLRKDKSEQNIWQDEGLRTQWFGTVQKGILYYNQGYEAGHPPSFLNKKIELIQEFIQGLKAIRNDLISDYDRLLLIQQLTPILDLALQTLSDSLVNKEIDFNTVLACFEAGKAFNLFSEYTLKKNLDEPSFRTYNTLIAEQKFIREKYKIPGMDLDQLQKQEAEIQSQLNEFLSIHAPEPGDAFSTLAEIQKQLDPNTTLLEFFKGSDHIYILVVNREKSQLLRYSINPTTFETDLNNLKLSILKANEPALISTRDSLFRNTAWNLYRILIMPIESMLNRKVIIVPDLSLAQIPFSALLTKPVNDSRYKHWPYWIHKHSISIQYSTTLWIDQLLETQKSVNKDFNFSFTAFAPKFEDLQFNVEECQKLAHLFNYPAGYYGINANRINFKKSAPHGRILHIASHAQSNEEVQERSFIRLHEDTLFGGEIGLMNLPIDLVFLSACETGTGKIISGEGMMSLARSFFQAGAQSVISTLWPIQDEISKEQVIRIYNGLKQGKPKDEAIQDMQIKYLAQAKSDDAFPAYWAAYQSQGNPDPLFPRPLHSAFYFLGLISIITFIIGSLIYLKYRNKEKLKWAA